MLPVVCSGLLFGLLTACNLQVKAQGADTLPPFIRVPAAKQYLNQMSQKGLAGQRYRLEWGVPVQAPVALLDTLAGGLRLDPAPAASDATELHLHDAQGNAYLLKPVQQLPARQLPDIYQGTIISDFAGDLASAYHPYAPLTIAPITRALGINYPAPRLVYLPSQKALGTKAEQLGNQLYYLQSLPISTGADTSTTWVSTSRLLELLERNNQNQVDAQAYVRLRLLDLLLGITTRNEDGWRWLAQPGTGGTVYSPLADGYESAFALYEGKLMTIAKMFAPIGHLVPFERQLPDLAKANSKSLHLDRRLTSGLSEKDWQAAAAQLRQSLTDQVLQNAILQLPMEVQVLSGREILAKLKSRRNALESYAQRYYTLLARKVDVLASASSEVITLEGADDKQITVKIFPVDEQGQRTATPLYQRSFDPAETKEINLYGIGGRDQYLAEGNIDKKIKLRIIGGPQQDSLRNITRSGSIDVYDNRSNAFDYKSHSRFHLRNDVDIHRYDFDAFAFNKKGLRPMVFYNNNDRIYAGISYNYLRQGWRKFPFRQRHKAYLNYSLWQGGISTGYEGGFNQIIGRWNGLITTEFDAIRWNNFFGIGNETPPQVLDNNFHRVRSEIFNADGGLFRPLGRHHSIGITARFQTVRIRPDTARYIGKTLEQSDPLLYRTHQFAGGRLTYSFQKLNDPLIPTKGFLFNASATYLRNIKSSDREIMNYATNLQWYVPLGRRWVWSALGGMMTVTGQPEFYQLASIGGSATLRGFRRERFWGKTAGFSQNEVMYLIPYRSYWFNGTLGLYGLFDAGRIWQPGETSDRLHTGYGAGLMIAPFHKIRVEIAYARSAERGMIHIG